MRATTETVEFTGHAGISCVAHGVLPLNENKTWNTEHVEETRQKAKVYSLTARLKNDVTPAYTIDWLENLDSASDVLRGSFISDKQETIDTRTLGRGAGAIELSARSAMGSGSALAMTMVINGVQLYLCVSDPDFSKGVKKPSYIFYVGNPDDAVRKKIRDVLSFSLGNYLVYLGCTTLCEKSEIVTFGAVSPPSIGRIFEITVMPPAPLGDRYECQQAVSRMANAIYAHYDELRFGAFSWVYWHAMCAPVHMAAAHFGAAIEAIQDAYVKSHPAKFEKKLITDKAKWESLSRPFLTSIANAGLDPSISTILTNKVTSNLNQTPPSVISEKLLAEIGITLSPAETAAWKKRHIAAHGGELDPKSVIPTIRATKLLKIILHRIVLKITGASESYYDDILSATPYAR